MQYTSPENNEKTTVELQRLQAGMNRTQDLGEVPTIGLECQYHFTNLLGSLREGAVGLQEVSSSINGNEKDAEHR